MSNTTKIVEKEFKILMIDSRNKNHRAYTSDVCTPWIENDINKSDNLNEGYDLEYAIDDESEGLTRDIYNEFTLDSLSCGVVNGLRVDDNGFLCANVRFKLPSSCGNLTKEIYSADSNLDDYAVVPKGKGSVKNQEVQDDYELYGFNLILKKDSSFEYDSESQEAETAE
tara:strand:- start:2987 stop:3493 length:507 start_codon:yes stop_codon:yes gene_type:complete